MTNYVTFAGQIKRIVPVDGETYEVTVHIEQINGNTVDRTEDFKLIPKEQPHEGDFIQGSALYDQEADTLALFEFKISPAPDEPVLKDNPEQNGDEPDDKEIIEATIETLNEIPDSDYGQAEILITSIAGTPVEDEYCHLILGPDAYDYSDEGDEITIELQNLKPCAEEDGSAEGKVYDIRPIAGTDFCVIAFVVNRIDGDKIQPTAHCIIDSKDHNFKLGDTAFLSPTSIDDDEEPDEPKRGFRGWVASGIASFFRWLIG